MAKDISSAVSEIHDKINDMEKKLLVVNKNQLTIENNSDILKRNFIDFKKNVLDAVKDELEEIDKRRSKSVEKNVFSEAMKNTKDAVKKANIPEKEREIEKRLKVLETIIDEKLSGSKLLTKKFDEEKRSMKDIIESKIGMQTGKMQAEMKDLSKYDDDRRNFIKLIRSVRDDVDAASAERRAQQKTTMDLVNTIEEVRERIDILEKDATMNQNAVESKIVDRVNDDVSALLGYIQEIKDRLQRLEHSR